MSCLVHFGTTFDHIGSRLQTVGSDFGLKIWRYSDVRGSDVVIRS